MASGGCPGGGDGGGGGPRLSLLESVAALAVAALAGTDGGGSAGIGCPRPV